MFEGIDDIDWGSLGHAYGSAENVPDWIRGLADPDPAVREESLDALHGAVHHQGDVYDSTLAAVPFVLEALTTAGLGGRAGIAAWLAGVADLTEWPAEDDLDEDGRAMLRHARQAHARIAAAVPALAGLAADPDPELRAAMPGLLAVLTDEIPGVISLLIGRLTAEVEPAVRRALLDTLGRLRLDPGALDRLLALSGDAPASSVVSTLIAVARNDPARLPLDGVVDLLERAYAEEAPPAGPAGFTTKTLAGSLRVMREKDAAGRRAPHTARLVEELTDTLGPMVAERAAIITPLLASPHADLAGDALFAANHLVDKWRGDHREIVERTGRLLGHADRDIAEWAEKFLQDWWPVSAPAVEQLAGRLADLDSRPLRDGLPAWAIPYSHDAPGLRPCLKLLAGRGDERAFAPLLATLRWAQRPKHTAHLFARYPQHAGLILAEAAEHAPDQLDDLRQALGTPPDGMPAEPLDYWQAQRLGRLGPAAAGAVPALRRALTGKDERLAVGAAAALWHIDRSPDALSLLTARLDGSSGTLALEEIGRIGADAADAAPLVATYLDAPPDRNWWKPAHAALALWRLTGEADRVAPVLTSAWKGNVHTRTRIAEAATGALAVALEPVIEEELAAPRRHNVTENGWSSSQVADDERLLELCRAARSARLRSRCSRV
jgi:hypothetical protein